MHQAVASTAQSQNNNTRGSYTEGHPCTPSTGAFGTGTGGTTTSSGRVVTVRVDSSLRSTVRITRAPYEDPAPAWVRDTTQGVNRC